MSTINRQHEQTVRLEARALETRISAMSVPDSGDSALVAVLLLVCKRLELIEQALRGREA